MRNFFIITNEKRDTGMKITEMVKELIHKYEGKAILASEMSIKTAAKEGLDCILTLGGDGTLMRAAREMCEYEIPFLGINLGHLGYLTEIELEQLESGIQTLVQGKPHIQKRMMLKNVCERGSIQVLNDIAITSKGHHRMLQFDVWINGEFLHSYKADGLVISTPTGSTGYNMSAGGPIVEPTAQLMVMTPICAHSLNSRSIILSARDRIQIKLNPDFDHSYEAAQIIFDGQNLMDLKVGHSIELIKSDLEVYMWKLNTSSFLETMRKKMEV